MSHSANVDFVPEAGVSQSDEHMQ